MNESKLINKIESMNVGDVEVFDINDEEINTPQNLRNKIYGYRRFFNKKFKTSTYLNKIQVVRIK